MQIEDKMFFSNKQVTKFTCKFCSQAKYFSAFERYQQQFINKMKESTHKKFTQKTFNYENQQSGETNRSSPRQPTFRRTPSPNKPSQEAHNRTSTLLKPYRDLHQSTEQYTPLAISPSQLLSARSPDDFDQLIVEHRYEVETLLLEIGRLQQELNQAHQLRQIQVRKIKEEYEQSSHLQISQIRQNQQGQSEVFEMQIRKLKEQLAQKTDEAKRFQGLLKREKDTSQREKAKFTEEVRLLIEKKNAQIYQLKQEGDSRMRQLQFQRNNQIEEIKYICDKEMAALSKELQKNQDEFRKLKDLSENQDKEKQKIIQYLQTERDSVERRYELRLVEQEKKYENIRSKFNELIHQFNQESQSSRADLQRLFEAQYQKLLNIVKTLQKDNNQIRKQLESEILSSRIEREASRQENQYLKRRIKQSSESSLQDMELLKIKLASLHQNDLKSLKELYQTKLKNSANNLIRLDEENSKLREFTSLLAAEKYELKKKYEITISQLNSKILKMRMGISTMENEFKQKLQNEKSVLLMTSRSILKEAEAKSTSNKFLQEEVRKLRQLMELQARENENAEKAVQQKILAANNELERLSNKVLVIAKEKQDLQAAMESLREEKQQEIDRLKSELNQIEHPERGIVQEIKIIEQLKEKLGQKEQQTGILKDKIQALQSRMKEMQAESQRLQMENNINSEEIRKEFHVVAESHLTNFKQYYQEKLKRVEDEKAELKKIITSQYEQITELVKKYKQTEEDLKQAVKVMKKRTELEEKVMNIGLDTNLIKNMTQLLPIHKTH